MIKSQKIWETFYTSFEALAASKRGIIPKNLFSSCKSYKISLSEILTFARLSFSRYCPSDLSPCRARLTEIVFRWSWKGLWVEWVAWFVGKVDSLLDFKSDHFLSLFPVLCRKLSMLGFIIIKGWDGLNIFYLYFSTSHNWIWLIKAITKLIFTLQSVTVAKFATWRIFSK